MATTQVSINTNVELTTADGTSVHDGVLTSWNFGLNNVFIHGGVAYVVNSIAYSITDDKYIVTVTEQE